MAKATNMERVNLSVPIPVKQWYKEYAPKMGTNMSNYMVYILCTHYQNMQTKNILGALSEIGTNEEHLKINKEMLLMFKALLENEKN